MASLNKRRILSDVRIVTHNLPWHSDIFIWEKQKADKVCLWIFHFRCADRFMRWNIYGMFWIRMIDFISGFSWHLYIFYLLNERMWLLTRTRTHSVCVVCYYSWKKSNNKNSRVGKKGMLCLFFGCGCVLNLICCWFFSLTPENHSIQCKFTVWMP